MRWFACLTLLTPSLIHAQDAGQVHVTLKSGVTTGQLVLAIAAAPASGDRIFVESDTSLLKVTVVIPDGRRINSANADANGFAWFEVPVTAPIGSTDGGYHAALEFKASGPSGAYTLEFNLSRPLPKPATIAASFGSASEDYDRLVASLPGVHRLGPVSLDSSKRTAELNWTLSADEGGTLIDVVVTDPNANVRLQLPTGVVLTPQSPKTATFEWKTVSSREQFDPPNQDFGLSGFLLPRAGTHHGITLATAAKGSYSIQAQITGNTRSELEAIVLPLVRIFKDASAGIGQPPQLPPGTVLLEPVALPEACFVGDRVNLAVRFNGDPIADPVRFRVQVETRAPLPYRGTGPQEYAAPKVVTEPVILTRSADGWYRGVLVPREKGILRVSIQASGTTQAGMTFTQDTVLPQAMVYAVAAKFLALADRAIDDNGNGRPDRLEIAATLDVAIPGKYTMRFLLDGGNTGGVIGDGSATLATGRHKLMASIPANRLFTSLKDGPYHVNGVQIFKEDGTFESVKGAVASLTTAAYKRDNWDRGDIFGEEKIAVHPLRPGKTGKFTVIEVDWTATTQGGACQWSGDLGLDNQPLHVLESGELPKGRSTFSFEFDARPLANATKSGGYFTGIASCGDGQKGAADTLLPVTIDPSQFERDDSPLRVFSQSMGRTIIGKNVPLSFPILEIADRQRRAVVYRLTSVPPGFTAQLQGAYLQVTASESVAPGRYFIGVEATSGNESGAGVVVVDAVRELPPGPDRKYDVGIATARGIRPDKGGKFQTIEVLWPVNIVPGGNCSWEGQMRVNDELVASVGIAGTLPDGKSNLSFLFDAGPIANSTHPNWIFRGHAACSNLGASVQQDVGARRDTELNLKPVTFAKRPGLPITGTLVQIFGTYGYGELSLRSAAPEAAVFTFGDLPAGFQAFIDRPHEIAGLKTARLKVTVDLAIVKPDRYFLPVKVTVGAEQGTTDVIVEVPMP